MTNITWINSIESGSLSTQTGTKYTLSDWKLGSKFQKLFGKRTKPYINVNICDACYGINSISAYKNDRLVQWKSSSITKEKMCMHQTESSVVSLLATVKFSFTHSGAFFQKRQSIKHHSICFSIYLRSLSEHNPDNQ